MDTQTKGNGRYNRFVSGLGDLVIFSSQESNETTGAAAPEDQKQDQFIDPARKSISGDSYLTVSERGERALQALAAHKARACRT